MVRLTDRSGMIKAVSVDVKQQQNELLQLLAFHLMLKFLVTCKHEFSLSVLSVYRCCFCLAQVTVEFMQNLI